MNTPPSDLTDEDVRQAVEDAWAVRFVSLEYVPKGFGTHHWLAVSTEGRRYFVNVDDLDTKTWLEPSREVACKGLRAAFATAIALREEAGLPFVVAPLPSVAGSSLERLTDRYTIALFPYVEGEGAEYGAVDRLSPEDREALLHTLGVLHRVSLSAPPPRLVAMIDGRDDLREALAELDQPWGGGPFSEAARAELTRHADTVRRRLGEFDALACGVGEGDLVITHGEPHPGNVMRAADGLLLVDWDTVALARPERDLWRLDDGSADGFATYTAVSGRSPDPHAIALHRLRWHLTDVALFTATLRAPHERSADTELGWKSLRETLGRLGAMSTRA